MEPLENTAVWQLQVCVQRRYAPNPTSCAHGGSEKLLVALTEAIARTELPITVKPVTCMLHCEQGPNIRLCSSQATMGQHQQRWQQVQATEIAQIVADCSGLKHCP